MDKKYWLYAALIVVAAASDLAFWGAFETTAYTVSMSFVMVALFVLILPFERALWWSIAQAVLLDLFSLHTIFGLFMVLAVCMVIVMTLLRNTWFKQTSAITVSLIASSGLLLALLLGYLSHGLLVILNVIPYNPFAVLSIGSILIGLLIENIIINSVIRIFSVFKRFVLL